MISSHHKRVCGPGDPGGGDARSPEADEVKARANETLQNSPCAEDL